MNSARDACASKVPVTLVNTDQNQMIRILWRALKMSEEFFLKSIENAHIFRGRLLITVCPVCWRIRAFD